MKFKLGILILFLCIFVCNMDAQITKKPWNQRGVKPYTQFTIASLNNKWGLVDDSGKVHLPFIYDSINYIDLFTFDLYYAGKVGVAHQFEVMNYDLSKNIQTVKVIEPVFTSLHQKLFFVKAYKDTLMALYYYDGSLLFPLSLEKQVCSLTFKYQNSNQSRNPSKEIEKNIRLIERDNSLARYDEPLIYYKTKLYRLKPDNSVASSARTIVSAVKLTKLFKRQLKKQHLLDCSD